MKNRYYLLALLIGLSACASGPKGRDFIYEPKIANPSAIIREEIAFNQLAQSKGQWTAFREFAAKDATMFVPQPIDAQTWLKGRADPAKAVKWAPHKSFMSCDGKTGATTGAWEKNGVHGYFTTIWQWFEKSPGQGEWKFVMDHGDELATPRGPGEWIETKVASCKGKAPAALSAPAEGAKMKSGYSRDQSLNWSYEAQPDGARVVMVKLWNGTSSDTVIVDTVAAPKS